MSSHNFETCSKCNTNAPLIACQHCQSRVCNGCYDKHDNICELMNKHVGISSDLCKVHNGEKVVLFCLVCSELMCCSCQPDHEHHIKEVYNVKDAVDLLKIKIPELKSAYQEKLSEAEDYIQRIPQKYRKIDEAKRKLESTDNNSLILSFHRYKTYIEQKCDKMDRFKIILTATIESLNRLEFLSNSYVFLPVWIVVVTDVDNCEDELNADSDDESDFTELLDYIRDHNIPIKKTTDDALQQDVKKQIPLKNDVDQLLHDRSCLSTNTDDCLLRKLEVENIAMYDYGSCFCSSVSKLTSKKIPAGLLPISSKNSFTKGIDFALEAMKNKLNDYKEEVHILQPRITTLEKANEKMKREQNERSNYELDEKNTLAAEVENLKKSNHDLEKKLKGQQKTYLELKTSHADIQTRLNEKDANFKELEKTIKLKEQKSDDRRTKEQTLYSQLEQSKLSEKNLQDKCKENGDKVKKLINSLEKQGSEVQQQFHTKSMEKPKTRTEDDVESFDTRTVDIERIKQSNKELEKELKIQREKARASNKELETLQSRIKYLEVAENNLKREKGKLEERVKEFQDNLRRYTSDIEGKKKEINDLNKKIQQKEAEKNKSQILVADVQKTLVNYTNDNKEKTRAIEHLEGKIQRFKAGLFDAQERYISMRFSTKLIQ